MAVPDDAVTVQAVASGSRPSPNGATTTNHNSYCRVVEPIPHEIGPEEAPLWRVTAATDPNTIPMELMPVWAVEIDPRKSENYMQFSRTVARRLRAAEQGGDGNEGVPRSRLRAGPSTGQTRRIEGRTGNGRYEVEGDGDDEDEGEETSGNRSDGSGAVEAGGRSGEVDSSEVESEAEEVDESIRHLRLFQRLGPGQALHALVCRVQDLPSREGVISLLKMADVTFKDRAPAPFQVEVPRSPAPSRLRLHEWKQYWPFSVKYGRESNTLVPPSLAGTAPSASSAQIPGVVDRAADARLWTPTARRWARINFRKCLRMAWEAQRRGEVPIGVHVTSTYPQGNRIVSGVGEGQSSIEVYAHDTRRSLRNPIKHAVTNVIRGVATVRSERDRERLQVLNAKVAHLYRDPHGDPEFHRQTMARAEAAVSSLQSSAATPSPEVNGVAPASHASSPSSSTAASPAPSLANGQDYLLNNLALFITHEPCVHCCMALVHSRVRAIFFLQPSPGAGGCCGANNQPSLQCKHAQDGGPYAVQEQAGLNHRFDVWRWMGEDDDLLQIELDQPLEDPTISRLTSDTFPTSGEVRLDIMGLDA